MNGYYKLFLCALLPVVVSALLYLIDKNTIFKKCNYRVKQTLFGIIFGGLAIFGTEFGISIVGVTMNVRDSAPICAGLIFGSPAGIIAGVIGGVERYLAAGWGAGEYTKVACSLATIFAGIFAAWLRKYMFDNKKPAWYYGFATGIIAEIMHMLMVFLTNMDDAVNAFGVVEKCTVPMVSMTGLSVMLATLIVSLLGKEKRKKSVEKIKISQTFQRRLLVCIVIAFFLTSAFTYVLQSGVSLKETQNLLQLNTNDIKSDISDASDANLLVITEKVAGKLNGISRIDNDLLCNMANEYDISEINIVDENGIITNSTNELFLGYDMNSGKQSAEFLELLCGRAEKYVQEYQPTSYDESVYRKYAGIVLSRGGFVQVAYDAEHFQKDIDEQIMNVTHNRHVGENGFLIICDKDFNVIGSSNVNDNKVDIKGNDIDKSIEEGKVFEANVFGTASYCMYGTAEGYYIVAVLPKSEKVFARNFSVYITVFMEVLVFTALFILIYFLIKKLIVDNIRKINVSLSQITNGNLDITVDVRSNEEFASLSDDINTTVATLKHYIDEAAARIDKELEFAKTIQTSALPRVFPPYPNRHEFEIWAGMNTAKEVGGDFYDFYMIGDNKLAFLIADVSGKGIPAAMFMMTSKTMIKNLAETGLCVEDVFTKANEELCESNDAGMFVTAWMGILDLNTGVVTFANAGHNPPLVKRKDGNFEYLKTRAGMVLAGMDGMVYKRNEFQLEPGDIIYLYTDGVTEATNSKEELYSEERLKNRLNSVSVTKVDEICKYIQTDIDEFVKEAPQFDDITMLCLKYNGKTEEDV